MTRDASYLLTAAALGFAIAMMVSAAAHMKIFSSSSAALFCRVLVPEASLTGLSKMDGFGIGVLGFLNAALYGFIGLFIGLTRDSWERIK